MTVNYRQVFAEQNEIIKKINQLHPDMGHKSGIYFYLRTDETGKKFAYIGKALDLIKRTASHFRGWNQCIDGSLKKRGLWSENNPYGWKLHFIHFPENELNERESYFIDKYKNAGYEMYNIESGGDVDTEDINERKPSRGYHDGLKQGYENARKEVAHWFELHLDYSIRGNPTLNKQKAYDRFTKFIKGDEEDV